MLPGFYSMLYDRYTQAHTVADGEIGGKAGSDIFLAQNVEDLLSHDTFSVKVEYGSYETADTGYFGKIYLNNLELPSGEWRPHICKPGALRRNVYGLHPGRHRGCNVLPVSYHWC